MPGGKFSVFCYTALLQIHPLSLSFASSKSRELLAYAQLYCRKTVAEKPVQRKFRLSV